jgi:hypothetical protein
MTEHSPTWIGWLSKEAPRMIGFLGRSIGPWGVLSVVLGIAVLVPSAVALVLAVAAVLWP